LTLGQLNKYKIGIPVCIFFYTYNERKEKGSGSEAYIHFLDGLTNK
jgi:hypothetical protein